MLNMTGDRKQEACDKLHGFELQVGEGMSNLIACGGDFPSALEGAKALCGSGGAGDDNTADEGESDSGDAGHLCNMAKAQVLCFDACLFVCVNWRVAV